MNAEVAMAELVRVCRPGSRVVVCDATPRSSSRDAYDGWERIRDPSHSSACTPEELQALATRCLVEVSIRGFRLDADVEQLIANSFPIDGGAELLTRLMCADVGIDALDMGARFENHRLRMSFPISIVAGTVPG